MTAKPESGQARGAIPLADPRGDLAHLRSDILAAVARVLDAGAYVLGSEVAEFERRIAGRFGVTGAVGVGSGTDALVLALLGLGVSSGDEVITVAHTAGATVAAIRIAGAVPVFIDIEPKSYCLDPQALEAAIGPRTRAILPVHLYGCPADMDRICAIASKADVAVIEDCAQAQDATVAGRPIGSIGNVGCFSFYPTKNLGAVGDGGLVAASRSEIIDRVRRLRTYGWSKPQFSQLSDGRCSRLDELQAAILNVKLDHLTAAVEARRAIAQQYAWAFSDLPLVLPFEPAGRRHVYHLYVVRCDRRDALARHLDRAGISTGVHYPYPVHVQPGLGHGARIPGALTVTEAAVGEILTLPLYPSMTPDDIQAVIASVRAFFGRA
jgi:dTDP-4-amino-4,6-dideoxygalactose transaminase